MTVFLRLLAQKEKAETLRTVCNKVREGIWDDRVYPTTIEQITSIEGAPFAYWFPDTVRTAFSRFDKVEHFPREARRGSWAGDDFRYLRLWFEVVGSPRCVGACWSPYAKGGDYSRFYYDFPLVVLWDSERETFFGFFGRKGRETERPESLSYYFRPGISWPLRSAKGFSARVLPSGFIFSNVSPSVFCDTTKELMTLLGLMNSAPFKALLDFFQGAFAFQVGVIQRMPIPELFGTQGEELCYLSERAWRLSQMLDISDETSHVFKYPEVIRYRFQDKASSIQAELDIIQNQIDDIAFKLYGFSKEDIVSLSERCSDEPMAGADIDEADYSDEYSESLVGELDLHLNVLSWAIGVAFGRFDWRLATGERTEPSEPEPFDPLPAKSPGMLPDCAEPFHAHAGILIDDQGHPHDLARLVEEVLNRVDISVPDDVRRWLQKDFFAFHLKCYSKSRRKAPIYWPLSTTSGSYTLWIYYPSLNNQTLFTAINDFLDGPNGKLTQVSRECAELRMKGSSRSRDEEKQYETLQTFEQELTDLRNTLLRIAPIYQPTQDDGVQITAAPLWPLFRHKPWQKVLKDTWTKLEKGDYDWAHLAMAYWPNRVREKCRTDKSLAIAHGLEALYIEQEVKPKKTRGKKNTEADK